MLTILMIGLLAALFADGYFSSARSVLTRFYLNRQLQNAVQDFDQGKRIKYLLDHYLRTDTSLAFLQMVSRLAAVSLVLAAVWSETAAVWSWLLLLDLFILALIITALEWGAALLVLNNPAIWMHRTSPVTYFTTLILRPLISLVFIFTRNIEEIEKKMSQVSEEDLKSLVDESRKDGLLEEEEQKMIHSVFRLDDTVTREIMVPRIDIEAIDVSLPLEEAVKHFLDSGYSRIPVYEDNIDDILGILYAKDLLETIGNGKDQTCISELVRPAYFVPESKKINELLTDMQKSRVHLAIVVDEYGGVSGIVTLEDIVEEIFGEIQDEFDDDEDVLYLAVGPDEYIFQGKIDIDDLNLIMDSSLPNQEADSLGGLVYFRLGHVPKRGEVVKFDDLLIKVEQVDEHRISKLRVKKLSNPQSSEENVTNDPD